MSAGQILELAQLYLLIGAVLAVPFLSIGINRIDENARGAWVFRAMMLPGVMLIWPLVAFRWLQAERDSREGQALHRPPFRLQKAGFFALALLIPVFVFAALILRQDGPFEAKAVMIEAPE